MKSYKKIVQSVPSTFLIVSGFVFCILIAFQNCAKVNFSQDILPSNEKLSNEDLVKAVDPVTYEPPVTPAGPVHGDIVGTLKPFAIEAQKVVPKTKMVIVVDNSGSMKNSQDSLAKGVESMLTSLEEQIQSGVNPNVEFYIVTTSIPQTFPSRLSVNTDYVPATNSYLYRPTFYGSNMYYNFTNNTLYNAQDLNSIAALEYYQNNTRLNNFILHYPTKDLTLKQNELDTLVGKNELLQFGNPYNSYVEPTTATYNKFKTYIGYDFTNDKYLPYGSPWTIPNYIYSSTGTPLSYKADFEFNTNYPIYNKTNQVIGSLPFSKLNLSPDVYLDSVKSADRIFSSVKFNAFKKDLTDKIKYVATKGSNQEMGLCALHRSLTMSGENQIFKNGDRAAFLIISDEQDAMTTWNQCPLKYEIAKETPLKFNISINCIGGSSCVMPTKMDDYTASFNWKVERTPANYNDPKIPNRFFSYSYTYNQAGSGQPNLQYYYYINVSYANGYAPFLNSEGRAVALKDGKDGRPLEILYATLNMNLSYNQYLTSPYVLHEFFTAEQAAALPTATLYGDKQIICRDQDLLAIRNTLLKDNPGFKTVYDNSLDADKSKLTSNCIVRLTSTIVNGGTGSYTPNFSLPAVSNDQCAAISLNYQNGVSCTAEQKLALEDKYCGVGANRLDNCVIRSCRDACSPAAKYLEQQSALFSFKTSDPDFAANFKAGYNKPFQAGDLAYSYLGYVGNITYKAYNTYEAFLADKIILATATPANGVTVSINKTPNPTSGTKTLSQITTDFSETLKSTDIGVQSKVDGLFTPVIYDSKTMTQIQFVAKMKEQLITSFHLRAKKLFNNNYFISAIVIPNDGKYANGMCPGTPLTEEQSPGSAYLQLLDDAYFTNNISVNGQVVTNIDTNRKAFADICTGDFTPALAPLKDFITNMAKNIYALAIPTGREIHSVIVSRTDLNNKPIEIILSQNDWAFDGKQLEVNIDKIEIGDNLTVNLTVPATTVDVRAPASPPL